MSLKTRPTKTYQAMNEESQAENKELLFLMYA